MSEQEGAINTERDASARTTSRATTSRNRGGSKKIGRRLVVLGAASIVAVYGAGDVGSISAARAAVQVVQTTPTATSSGGATKSVSPTATPAVAGIATWFTRTSPGDQKRRSPPPTVATGV